MYCNKFFKTKEQAQKFQKYNGGVLYSNAPHSRTKKEYNIERLMMEHSEQFANEYPFVVAWNEQNYFNE